MSLREMGRKALDGVRKGTDKVVNFATNRYAQAGALVSVSGSAMATETPTLDTTDAVAFIEGDVTDGIVAVGGAIIVLAALAMGFKWIKGALFG